MSTAPDTSESGWTIGRLLSWTAGYLEQRGVDDARLASEVLLAHATDRRRIDLYARPDELPEPEQTDRFRALVKRAATREPIAYLVGEKEFFSLRFAVSPAVLIPRPETETLVEKVIDHCTAAGLGSPFLLDVGTGSGCLAITALTQLANARAVGTDVSEAALTIAYANAERHGVADRFTAIKADRLALPDSLDRGDGFDVLMSNPPYVEAGLMAGLDPEVRDFEPHEALTDGGDGLSFYRAIAAEAAPLLVPGGMVFVEVGDGQAPAVQEAMDQSPEFSHCSTWKDPVVGQERVLVFKRR